MFALLILCAGPSVAEKCPAADWVATFGPHFRIINPLLRSVRRYCPGNKPDYLLNRRLFYCSRSDGPPEAHYHDPVCDLHQVLHVVGNQDHAYAMARSAGTRVASTCWDSRTPKAAVGSSRITVRRPHKTARAIARHCL